MGVGVRGLAGAIQGGGVGVMRPGRARGTGVRLAHGTGCARGLGVGVVLAVVGSRGGGGVGIGVLVGLSHVGAGLGELRQLAGGSGHVGKLMAHGWSRGEWWLGVRIPVKWVRTATRPPHPPELLLCLPWGHGGLKDLPRFITTRDRGKQGAGVGVRENHAAMDGPLIGFLALGRSGERVMARRAHDVAILHRRAWSRGTHGLQEGVSRCHRSRGVGGFGVRITAQGRWGSKRLVNGHGFAPLLRQGSGGLPRLH